MQSKAHIMIVDDDQSTLEILQMILKNAGYKVTVSDDGHIDRMLSEGIPDLFLVDYHLGDRTGDEVCRELRANAKTSRIPLIMISAMQEIESLAEGCSVDDYLPKPFSIQQLQEIIRKTLNRFESLSASGGV